MNISEQYVEANRRIQENWAQAFEAVNSQFQKQADRPVPFGSFEFPQLDGDKMIDEAFDFWSRALEVQRETAKKMFAANRELVGQWRTQAEQFQTVVRDQAQNLGGVTREQVDTLASAAREQAKNYTDSIEEQVRTATEAAERYSDEASKAVRETAEVVGDASVKATDAATEAVQHSANIAAEAAKETTEITKDAAEKTAKRNYNLMNQAQLKAELTSRKLLSTGTLDEMRARLREHDDA